MGLDVVWVSEIRSRLIAAVVLMIRDAQYQGGNEMYLAGALALAENRARTEGLNWTEMLGEMKAGLSKPNVELLDTALRLELGDPL